MIFTGYAGGAFAAWRDLTISLDGVEFVPMTVTHDAESWRVQVPGLVDGLGGPYREYMVPSNDTCQSDAECFIALTSEYTPARLRAPLVTLMWSAFLLGGLLGGLLNCYLIPHSWLARDLLYRRCCRPLVLPSCRCACRVVKFLLRPAQLT